MLLTQNDNNEQKYNSGLSSIKRSSSGSLSRGLSSSNQDVTGEYEKGRQELIKTANLMFSIFEPNFIWDFCGSQFEKASCQTYRISDNHEVAVNNVGSVETTVVEMCALTDFLLEIISCLFS